jgi:hypothetical protein
MGGSSLLWLHWLDGLEETMTHVLWGFKDFHESCAALPHPWRPERRSGKVRSFLLLSQNLITAAILIANLSDNSCRIPCDNGIGRYVLSDDTPSPNDGVLAHSNAAQ